MPPQLVRKGEKGRRAGEQHPNARFSNVEIEVMRQLHEECGIGYRRLGRIFGCTRSYARKVCKYQRRP